MSRTVDYYFAPQSPWTYLGHERFAALARASGSTVRVRPVDLGGKVFPISGGLPLGKRAPQRQAYRLLELRRFSEFLHAPLNVQPRFFPVAGDDASQPFPKTERFKRKALVFDPSACARIQRGSNSHEPCRSHLSTQPAPAG